MFSVKTFLPKVKRHFREDLEAPFIIVSQGLLFVCTGLLILGNAELANGVTTGDYSLPSIGVALHSLSFVRYEKEAEEEDDGKND